MAYEERKFQKRERSDRPQRGGSSTDRKRSSKSSPRFGRLSSRYEMPKDAVIDYKNFALLQKYLNDRGKIVPRRISGISSKTQRQLTSAIKKARFLALLTTGSPRR